VKESIWTTRSTSFSTSFQLPPGVGEGAMRR
jgi:hypothetical protein